MELTAWELQFAFVGCVAVATYVQNLTGFAFGLILLGLVSVLRLASVPDAANAATLLTLANTVSYLRLHPLQPQWRVVTPAIVPSLLGVAAGVALLAWLSSNAALALRGLLGVAIVACALLLLVSATPRAQLSSRASFRAIGALSGLMGGLFSSAGPPLVFHLYRQPLPRDVVQQCLVLMFGINQLLRLVLILAAGRFTTHSIVLGLSAFPVVYAVTWWQHRHPPQISAATIRRATAGLLMLAGGSMVASLWLRTGT